MKQKRKVINQKTWHKLLFVLFVCTCTLPLFAQQGGKHISGNVADEEGKPIIGASIFENGTRNGVVSGLDGKFSLDVSDKAVLHVSYIGYISQDITVGNQTNLNITLREDNLALDEVVVVGYGTQKKANLTGAVDQVTSEVFEKRSIVNVNQGLVGVIPNLNIRLLDGKPNQQPSFNIRGTTSIGQGGSALVLIDGVEGAPGMLNPNDIESVSILKDAGAAAIYGARAAFGVVLITTKSASKGKTSITYSTLLSSKKPTRMPDNITDSYPWAQSYSDAFARFYDNGTTPTSINTVAFSPQYLAEVKRRYENPELNLPLVEVNPFTGAYEYYYSHDMFKEIYKDSFFAQDHNLSVSGGNDIASFYVTGHYNGQDGLYLYNTDKYSAYNFRAKGDVQLTNWLQVANNTEYSNYSYHQPINVGYSNIWRMMADSGIPLQPISNPDGTLTYKGAGAVGDLMLGKSFADVFNAVIKNKTSVKADFLNKSLTLRADFTFQNTSVSQDQIRVQVPYSSIEGQIGYIGSNTNDYSEQIAKTDYMAANVYANYEKSFNHAHNFNFLAGYNYEQQTWKNVSMSRNGIIEENIKDINLAIGESMALSGGYNKWRTVGTFFRVNYNFKERYLLELNGRYDGSSRFPENSQWGFFPSVSAGWRLTEESFWHVNPKALSNLKFRLSYGSLGNGSISPYSFSENFSVAQAGYIVNGIRPLRTTYPNVVPSSLTWETVTTGNIGLDVNSLNNRLSFTGDLYRRWTTNMYTVGPSVPAIFGASVPKGNYADLKTTGWELSLNWADRFLLASKPFNYNVRFTLSDYNAIITKYYNPDKNLSDYYEGMKIGEIWGYRVEGLFKSLDEIANSPSQSNIPNTNTRKNYPGDLKFKNLDGDNVIYQGLNRVGDSGDKTIIGNNQAHYVYGINIGADYRGFFFSSFFQGVMKQQWYPSSESPFWGQYNRPNDPYPRWQENQQFREELQNFDAYLPRLVGYIAQGRFLSIPNDRYLQNVAYIRLRNINIGYTLPKTISQKIGSNNIQIYFSGDNLWNWSPLYKITKDYDVNNVFGSGSSQTGTNSESAGAAGDGYNYATLKSISLGLTVNF